MNIQTSIRRRKRAGSLVLVLVVTAAGILLVSGVLTWTSTNSNLTQRVQRHDRLVAAAGAATEKVAARMMRDFQSDGNAALLGNLDIYRSLVPSTNDLVSSTTSGTDGGGLIGGIVGILLPSDTTDTSKEWAKFQFDDAQGNAGRTYVNPVSSWAFTDIPSRYPGLRGYNAKYRVVSNVRNTSSTGSGVSGVKQDLVVASIPVFQYQVFYGPDLEFHPGTVMALNGRVHCNGSIYCQPAEPVSFLGAVTASQRLTRQKHPLDPIARSGNAVSFPGGYESGVNSLHLPLGTNTSLAAYRSIIKMPPTGESTNSVLGRQRLYNKADLIILVSNNVGVAKSGAYNNFSVKIPWTNIAENVVITWGKGKGGGGSKGKAKKKQVGVTNVYDGVVATNVWFWNHRENKIVRCTEIDIAELLEKFSYLTNALGRPIRTLYVADCRPEATWFQSGVRVVYGDTLPSGGLTIVTPNPLYVEGDYNVRIANLGTTNTAGSVPAALIADAITLLSEAWYDTNSFSGLSARVATNATINAALVGGIVPSGNGYYSGGLENMPRLLEDWTGKTLTINGSLGCLYRSEIATAPWGARTDVYKPPLHRRWSFDSRFSSLTGLPPSTPEVRTIIRRGWEVVQANRVN